MVSLGDPHLSILRVFHLSHSFTKYLSSSYVPGTELCAVVQDGSVPVLVEETDCGPRAKASPISVCVNKVLLAYNHTHSCSIVCSCFPAKTGELSSWDRHRIAHNPENIYF